MYSCLAANNIRNTTRIVGGEEVDIEDVPYQLSLQEDGFHLCGATIISDRWAVTAAHCTYRLVPILCFSWFRDIKMY